MALRSDGLRTKKRVLSTCARLFLENGYHSTTMQQISRSAGASISSIFNLFHSKEGILLELVQVMFEKQFGAARDTAGSDLPPVYIYAVETAIQLGVIEQNENLRDIYLEAYTGQQTLGYIQRTTAVEIQGIFGSYQPELTAADFLALEYCTAGIMRGCMANRCTESLTLEKKLSTFLRASLRVYRVPEDEVQRVVDYVLSLDIRALARQVMQTLFHALSEQFNFSLSGILPEEAGNDDDEEY